LSSEYKSESCSVLLHCLVAVSCCSALFVIGIQIGIVQCLVVVSCCSVLYCVAVSCCSVSQCIICHYNSNWNRAQTLSFLLWNGPFEKRPVMSRQDSDDHSDDHFGYGVATSSRLLKIIGLFCRISSFL